MDAIKFVAAVYKVQTLATDGGIRITLDLAGDDKSMVAMTELGACQIHGVALEVEAKALINSGEQRSGNRQTLPEGPKRESKWQTSQE